MTAKKETGHCPGGKQRPAYPDKGYVGEVLGAGYFPPLTAGWLDGELRWADATGHRAILPQPIRLYHSLYNLNGSFSFFGIIHCAISGGRSRGSAAHGLEGARLRRAAGLGIGPTFKSL